jgi:hypothetical protein
MTGKLKVTNIIVPIVQAPYFNDIDVEDIHTTLEGLINKVKTGLKATPVS